MEQVRAIFVLKGPCFPVSESQVTEIILLVNGLTGVPWGAPEQSGGFNSLCKKLSNKQLEGCDSSGGDSGSGRRLLQDAACKNDKWYVRRPPLAATEAPGRGQGAIGRGQGSLLHIGSLVYLHMHMTTLQKQITHPLEPLSCRYLYLDSTNPPDASDTIMLTLRNAIANGDFMAKLAATSAYKRPAHGTL